MLQCSVWAQWNSLLHVKTSSPQYWKHSFWVKFNGGRMRRYHNGIRSVSLTQTGSNQPLVSTPLPTSYPHCTCWRSDETESCYVTASGDRFPVRLSSCLSVLSVCLFRVRLCECGPRRGPSCCEARWEDVGPLQPWLWGFSERTRSNNGEKKKKRF